MYKFYEFFAGGGMVRAGLGSGWQCLFANDFSETKAHSYSKNWGNQHLCIADIAKITSDELPDIADLAWASFPCQDMSLAGTGNGLKGQRSGTFWAFTKLIKQLERNNRAPKIITLENVNGTITSHNGDDFVAIINEIASIGYKVGAIVVDAAHFLPQSRPRLFIIAILDSLHLPPSLITNNPIQTWHPLSIVRAQAGFPKALQDKWIWWSLPTPTVHIKTLKELVELNTQTTKWHPPEETNRLINMMTSINVQKIKHAQASGNIVVGTLYKRMRNGIQRAEVRFDGIAGCLRTPTGGSSLQTIIVVHDSDIKTRLLTPREAARLMGLDEEYQLPEKRNDAYRLVGDGVAVPVITHLEKYLFGPLLSAI